MKMSNWTPQSRMSCVTLDHFEFDFCLFNASGWTSWTSIKWHPLKFCQTQWQTSPPFSSSWGKRNWQGVYSLLPHLFHQGTPRWNNPNFGDYAEDPRPSKWDNEVVFKALVCQELNQVISVECSHPLPYEQSDGSGGKSLNGDTGEKGRNLDNRHYLRFDKVHKFFTVSIQHETCDYAQSCILISLLTCRGRFFYASSPWSCGHQLPQWAWRCGGKWRVSFHEGCPG